VVVSGTKTKKKEDGRHQKYVEIRSRQKEGKSENTSTNQQLTFTLAMEKERKTVPAAYKGTPQQ
jgi:hypothetical protein